MFLVVLREETEPGPFPDRLRLTGVEREESKKIDNRRGDGKEKESRKRPLLDPDEESLKKAAELFDLLHRGTDFKTGRGAAQRRPAAGRS